MHVGGRQLGPAQAEQRTGEGERDDGGAAHQRQPHHRQRQRHRDRTYHGLCREKHDGRRDGRTPRQRDDQRGQARHLGHNAT